jgi:hypothetical protein
VEPVIINVLEELVKLLEMPQPEQTIPQLMV